MKREDYLDLIRAYNAILRLEDACEILTGINNLTCGKCKDLNYIYDILFRNSVTEFYCPNSTDEDEIEEAFFSIIENREMTPEEKCKALLPN